MFIFFIDNQSIKYILK